MAAGLRITIAPIGGPDDIGTARELFAEYVGSLGVDLGFQDLEAELAGLPGTYAPPEGAILIARDGAHAVGCAALRPLSEPGSCEIKRLYVRPAARGHDLGRRLATAIIALAKEAGYARMKLDTLAPMRTAQHLYASLGFRPTEPYYANPLPGTRYMILDL